MKKSIKLLILVLVLAVVAGGYAAIRHFSPGDSPVTAEPTTVTAAELDPAGVASISWKNSETEVSLYLGDDGSWRSVEDDAFPVDQSYPKEMLSAVSSVPSYRLVTESSDNPAQYGLTEPAYRAVIKLTDGSAVEYYIGSSAHDGSYYFKTSLSDGIYLIEDALPSCFERSLLDIAELEAIPRMDGFDSLSITVADTTSHITVTRGDSEEEGNEFFVELDGKKTAVQADRAAELQTAVSSLAWSDCVDYTGDYESYGLDSPNAKIVVGYTDADSAAQTFTLLLGTKTEASQYYACIEGSKMIYLIDGTAVSPLIISAPSVLLTEIPKSTSS